MANRPECEICGNQMIHFEITLSLDTFGYLICYDCVDEDE